MKKLKSFILRHLGIPIINKKLDNLASHEKELKKQTRIIKNQITANEIKMDENLGQMQKVECLVRQLSEDVKRLQKANATEHLTMQKELGKKVKDVDIKTRHIYSRTRALELAVNE